MPRGPRLFIPGLSQHVIQRGNNRGAIFRAPFDYQFFLTVLRHAAGHSRVDVHGYVLMTNHFHLIVTSASPTGLPEMMQTIGRTYVRFFNARYERTGALWEGRYRASMLHDEKYWMTCLRYVELNPVRAGLVAAPELYRWSSYRTHAVGRPDPLVRPHSLYLAIGATAADRQQAWRTVCESPIQDGQLARIRHAIHAGKALSESAFSKELKAHSTAPKLSRLVNGV